MRPTKNNPFVSFPTVTTGNLPVVVSTAGIALLNGQSLLGKELLGTYDVRVRIDAVVADPPFGDKFQVSVSTPLNVPFHPYCANGGYARVVGGKWSHDATRGFESDRFTLACDDGVISKCFRFGYAPDNVKDSSKSRMHQACTRAARQDVCKRGAGSREGTHVVFRDLVPGYKPHPLDTPALTYAPYAPAPPDEIYYESVWGTEGIVCMESDRWNSVRNTGCQGVPDPRVDVDAKFCRDMTPDEVLKKGGLIAIGSRTQDRVLRRWRNPTTNDVVTTIRGFVGVKQVAPFPGYTEMLGEDGVLLRNLPASLTLDDVVPVYSIVNGTDRWLGPSTTLTTDSDEFEGYVIRTRPGVVRFGIYYRGNDTLTSRNPEDTSFVYDMQFHNVLANPGDPM
ncbi:MAG TPA: ADYC domain-containing protein [Kofleriaceae bacterium]|nr:ADYC domain-containing protein [Kofleriaceae bacterium]